VPSRFINKAALMTTNCFGAVTHTERRFQFRHINRWSHHVSDFFSFPWSGLTGFKRRHRASTLSLTIQNCICVSLITLRGQFRNRYSLPSPGFSESGIHLASATGYPLNSHTGIHRQFIYKGDTSTHT